MIFDQSGKRIDQPERQKAAPGAAAAQCAAVACVVGAASAACFAVAFSRSATRSNEAPTAGFADAVEPLFLELLAGGATLVAVVLVVVAGVLASVSARRATGPVARAGCESDSAGGTSADL